MAMLLECYINFGSVGVALGMFTIGLICAALERSLSASVGGAVIGCTIFSQWLGVESDFVLVFGEVPYMFLALYAFVRALPAGPASTAV
jgi:hypothetical protein